jgi:ABC-type uncharacterized transport system auxiliary subunit
MAFRITGSTAALAVVVGTALSVTSCGGLLGGKSEPHAIYVLALPRGEAQPATPGACGTLEVASPEPAAGFGSMRMVYQREPHRLEPFAHARWAEPVSPMVQAAFVQALGASGRFAAVLPAPAAVTPDIRLESDELRVVQRFEGGGSRSEISMDVRLVDLRASRLLASRHLSASADAMPNPAGGVEGANGALADLVQQLVALAGDSLDCAAQASDAG